jgi:membrane AbrB-like protein
MSNPATPEGRQPARSLPTALPLALALGTAGGFVLWWFRVPLAWMLGAMLANCLAAVRGLPVAIPSRLRTVVLCIVGVFLGGSFGPELIGRAAAWASSLALMLVFVPMLTMVAYAYYRRVAGFDRPTAAFSAAPGTLTAAVILGGESGGNGSYVALSQTLRVAIIVILIPQIIAAALSAGPGLERAAPVSTPWSVFDLAALAAAAAVGFGLGTLLRLPAASMSGAMVTAAALYMSGAVTYHPPLILQNVAFVVLGSAVGSQFANVTAGMFLSVGKHAIVSTAIIIAVSAVFAYGASALIGTPYLTDLLSFTPGGIPEMSIIAIAFGIDPAFVAVHHLTRVAILIAVMPMIARIIARAPR